MKDYFYKLATDQIDTFGARLAKKILWLLSLLYGLGVRFLALCYHRNFLKRHRLNAVVISVGNLTWGGVGKTPFVEFVARYLCREKMKTVILSRGYMSEKKTADASFSDEVTLLQRLLPEVPVLMGRDRVKTGREAVKSFSVETIVLDDGFQHWRLFRDFDIVLVDVTQGFGNGHLIPRGILREPLKSLKRADVILLTKTNLVPSKRIEELEQQLLSFHPEVFIAQSIHEPLGFENLLTHYIYVDPLFLKGKKVCSFCSIGDPASFQKILLNLGANVMKNFPFLDHHVYTSSDIRLIADYAKQEGIEFFVTTEKDSVKLDDFLSTLGNVCPVLSLKIQIKLIRGETELLNRLRKVCNRK